ncbi:flavin-containing monooxygenase [Devosia sediminis]|jgi:putative flavoprotein involved in K+ transport|uniref:NAD(P)-binding domain-containing protein n=1 Tax=Devosia sediminis TaxID=2798801 RepID=A0A934IWL5_9HYPH|nr:NAD(P)/FAD-dependent oxidoreductase [Devosia sediminis]MBJ3783642.1 NAD(P)-binding domain-containing protein [Devosia sediminis]
MKRLDVVVIGAGQAGLATGRLLADAGLDFAIFDAGDRTGDSWRRRYEGLTLFTPRVYSGLGGMAMAGEPTGYPDKDEFADYLEAYAARFRLPVEHRAVVASITRDSGGRFIVSGSGFDTIAADAVVMATGAFRDPIVPSWAAALPSEVAAMPAEEFGDGSHLPPGPLLVVGDGASGRDIAVLARPKREVVLATGRPRRLLPERLLGKSLWWWLDVTGLVRAPTRSLRGRAMRRSDPFPNRGRRALSDLAAEGIRIKPRATGVAAGMVGFADGSAVRPAAVVWAIGYKADWSLIEVENVLDGNCVVRHDDGISPVEGLYFVGLPWQRNRASGLVMGVSADAAVIVDHLLRRHLARHR